jgi:hypothetical protein
MWQESVNWSECINRPRFICFNWYIALIREQHDQAQTCVAAVSGNV